MRLTLLATATLMLGHVAHAATPAPDVATDPAGAWTAFLDTADFEKVYASFGVLDKIGYGGAGVDADACKANAAALRTAVDVVPVSIVLRRASMLCAEATHDDALAERETKALGALAKHALASAVESANAAPIRVVRQDDAYALLAAAGLEHRYEYYQDTTNRSFPLVVAAWDPERKLERHLRFDYLDTGARITREGEGHRFLLQRVALVRGMMEGNAQQPAVIDLQAKAEANDIADPARKIAKLRAGTAAGGIRSAQAWIAFCRSKDAPRGCADGMVDALLPYAEKQWAEPMALLAFAYDSGLGVKRDAAAADALLEAADARWAHHGATLEFVDLWLSKDKASTLPRELRQRIDRALADGNENARMMVMYDEFMHRQRDLMKPLPADDVAFLSSPQQNGEGQGFKMLEAFANVRGDKADALRWQKRAADAGSPDAQATLGFAMLYGRDGVAKDKPGGEQMLEQAAIGGNTEAAQHLADEAIGRREYALAEKFIAAPASFGDRSAVMTLASLYEYARPGVSEGPEAAIRIYQSLADTGDAYGRRRLADMAFAGRGMPKDSEKARKWLLQDAETGDAWSEARLSRAYLGGEFGAVDEREGMRWGERSVEHDVTVGASTYGHWLYYTKATPDARGKAIGMWRKAVAHRDADAANNLAWVRCTSRFDDERDPKEGLKALAVMGTNTDDLDPAEIDTAAACQAANGQFDQAKKLQAVAMQSLARNISRKDPPGVVAEDDDYKDYGSRLALYSSGKAYREPETKRD
ncbi:sel1 repeat family protein [Lysobacter sp. KIS68-7]|uniref:tetratricopeptide repeat protein n=1 Tax=Lysobacter sp. KIS68-7 TaxID=2904252 RepID=UPI001E292F89|nr:tetratricopeptide repeat protein [Lysobacter sp. KIS68-7]UHQ20886.1 sel1 repeat family protein [Lysobacter sp. KIS68-7]